MRTQVIDKAVVVSAVKGNIQIMMVDGTSRPLQPGEILQPGAKLSLADDATLLLAPYDDGTATPATEPAAADIPSAGQTAADPTLSPEIAALQQSILQGIDPTQNFEAAAAGGAPAAGGGGFGGVAGTSGNGGFVTIDRTGDSTIATAGYDSSYEVPTLANAAIGEALVLADQLADLDEAVSTPEDVAVSGNVLVNTTNPDGPQDAALVSYDWGINLGVPAGVAATLTGIGTLLINGDGSYLFTPALNYDGLVPAATYFVTDGLLTVQSTLAITITPLDEGVEIGGSDLADGELIFSEAALVDGSAADPAALTQSGSFTFNAADGVASVSVAGLILLSNGQPITDLPQTLATPLGNSLAVTGISYNPVTGAGSVSYRYSLNDSQTHGASDNSVVERFELVVTDEDGDSTSASLDIVILDDSPSVTVTGAGSPGSVTLDESPVAQDGVISVTLTAAQVQAQFTNVYGADGVGTIGYSLALSGQDVATGLYGIDPSAGNNRGSAILLNQVGNVLTGSAAGVDYFTLTLDPATGAVTLTQLSNLWHGDTTSADDSVALRLAPGLLLLTQTLTDGDGDSASASIELGSGDIFTFEDDGPSAEIRRNEGVAAVHDETAGNQEDSDGLGAIPVALAELSVDVLGWARSATGVVSVTGSSVGQDSAGSSTLLSLAVVGGDGADSGLRTTAGERISLSLENGVVVGRIESGPLAGSAAFAVMLGADGTLSVAQYRALQHNDSSDNDDLVDLSGKLLAVVTVTDGDGDTAVDSVAIGSAVRFEDDGPSADLINAQNSLDDEGLPGGINGGTYDIPAANTRISGGLNIEAGADGLKAIALAGPASLGTERVVSSWDVTTQTLTISSIRGVLLTVTLTDPATGAYQIDLLQPLMHPVAASENNIVLNIGYTVTDGDDDTASGALVVTINDDTPAIQAGNLGSSSFVTFHGSSADFANSYGYYSKGEDGTPLSGKLIWSDVNQQGEGTIATLTGLDPAYTGFFIIPNGGANADLTDGAEISFRLVDGKWQGFIGEVPLSGADGANVLFSDATLNPGGAHLQDTGNAGNQNWEDSTSSPDYDYNDVSTSITWGSSLQVDESNLASNGKADFSGLFTVQAGADGLQSMVYQLMVQNGNSGLVDTATKEAVILTVNAEGVVEGRTAVGNLLVFTLAVDASGMVTLDQQRAIVHPSTDPDEAIFIGAGHISLAATVTDRDGDQASASIDIGTAISVKDAGPHTLDNQVVQLDDDALAGGNDGGSNDDPDRVNISGILGHSSGADGIGNIQWLSSGAPAGFSYEMDQNGALLVKQGANTVLTVTLDPATGAYEVSQQHPISQAQGDSENNQLFTLTYQVTDKDGDTASGTLQINVDDDTPQAKSDLASVSESAAPDINMVFVLDFSGSISNLELGQMLSAVKSAAYSLFQGNPGHIQLQVVAFSSEATAYPVMSSYSAFAAMINAMDPNMPGGVRPYSGGTDFTAAIEKTMDAFNPLPGANNQVVFISDGDPTEQTEYNNALLEPTAVAWARFIADHKLNVTTIGVGDGIDNGNLQDVDLDGSNAPILLDDASALVKALLDPVSAGQISGNVLLGSDGVSGTADDDGFGADGAGRILSITVDGTTFNWNGAATTAQLNDLVTALGGSFSFNFTTGAWHYTAPGDLASNAAEQIGYTLVDADGDPSDAILTINIAAVDNGPVAINDSVSTSEDTAVIISTSGLFGADGTGVTNDYDLDSAAFTAIKVIQLATDGVLKLNGVAVTLGQVISVADIAANKLIFMPDSNEYGPRYATFKYQVSDGNSDSNTATVTINVTPVNDGPVAVDDSITTTEDTAVIISASALFGSDGAGAVDDYDIDSASFTQIKIIELPLDGVLKLNGVNVVQGQGISVADIAANKLTFVPDSNEYGPAYTTFKYQVSDGNSDSNTATVTINVTPVNDGPVAVDDSVTTFEDTAVIISASALFGSDGVGAVNDYDIDSASFTQIKIMALPLDGVLKLNGVNVAQGQVISAADIAANKLTFMPDSNEHGPAYATFKYQVSDGNSDSNTATVTINVTPVNDGPVAVDDSVTTTEDTAVIISASALFGSDGAGAVNDYDIDSASFTQIKIIELPLDGVLKLNGVNVVQGQGISVADIAANKLTFVPDSNEYGPGYATFKYQVSDGNSHSNTATVTINVTPVNDAPLLDLDGNDSSGVVGTGYQTTYTEGMPAIAIADMDTLISDVDNSTIVSAKVVLTNAQAGDLLTVGGLPQGIQAAVDTSVAGKITLTLTGLASQASYSTALEAIRFTNTSTTPSTIPRDLTLVVNDGAANSNTAHTTVQVVGVDFAPDARDDQATVVESKGINLVFVLDFSGSINNDELDQMLSAVREAGQDLFANASGAVTVQLVAFSTEATSYAQVSSFAALSAQLAAINPYDGGWRPFDDDTNFSVGIEQTMAVYQPLPGWTNQVVFISDGNPNLQMGTGDNALDDMTALAWQRFVDQNNINVTTVGIGNGINLAALQDVDLDGQGAPVTVADFGDLVVALLDQVGGYVSGNVLHGSDNVAGTTDDDRFGGDGAGYIRSIVIGTTTYTWNGSSTITASSGSVITGTQLTNIDTSAGGQLTFNFATGAWRYVAPQGLSADLSEQFSYSLVDANGTSDSAILTVKVLDLNMAPTGSDGTLTLLEDGQQILTVANFGFSDSEGDSLLAVKITTLPSAGVLTLTGGAPIVAGSTISVADIAAGKLVYTPAANGNGTGYGRFTFQVQDDGGTANGGQDLDQGPNSITFNVTAVNDAPTATISNSSYSATEGTSLRLSGTGISVSDPDGGSGLRTVTLGVSQGVLNVTAGNSGVTSVSGSGTASITFRGTLTQLNNLLGGIDTGSGAAGSITYSVNLDAPAQVATLALMIQDEGQTGGGALQGGASAQLNIVPVNDSGIAQDDSVYINVGNGVAVPLPAWALLYNDSDPDSLLAISNLSNLTNLDASLATNADVVTLTDSGVTAGGRFNYTIGGGVSATVTVTRDITDSLDGNGSANILVDGVGGGHTLNGNNGNDILIGNDGDDSLNGGSGDDLLVGGSGKDSLNGGSGSDTAGYLDASSGVTVDLGLIIQQDTKGAGMDTLTAIENLLGSAFNDTLTGSSGNNVLNGLAGDDLLMGGRGNDTLTGGQGSDTFKWVSADSGGTDTLTDFQPDQGDRLDIAELLSGEHANGASLDQYLSFRSGTIAGQSLLIIDLDGSGAGTSTQTIKFENIDLTVGGTRSDQYIIEDMLLQASLKVDP